MIPAQFKKFAVYLNDVDDDPMAACVSLAKLRVQHVALKFVWGQPIGELTDTAHKRLRGQLAAANLKSLLLASNVGMVRPNDLAKETTKLQQLLNLCNYYGASFVRLGCGIGVTSQEQSVNDWMSLVTERCIAANVVPLLEPSDDQINVEPSFLVQLLIHHRKWKLLYDPGLLLAKRNRDPFSKLWPLLRQHTAVIDIHDYSVARGHKPVGQGDAKLALTITDALSNHYNGWFAFEPSLGRHYGSATSTAATFAIALAALEALGETKSIDSTTGGQPYNLRSKL